MSLDDDSLLRMRITPDKGLRRMPSSSQDADDSTINFRFSKSNDHEDADDSADDAYGSQNEDNSLEDVDEEGCDHNGAEGFDGGGNNSDNSDSSSSSSEDENDNGNARPMTNDQKLGRVLTSTLSLGSISSVGLGSMTTNTNISVSSSAQNSIMKRLLFNIAVDPEPFPDDQSTVTTFDLPDIERPKKRRKIQQCSHVPSQRFPDKSLPTELLEDFMTYMKEYKARQRYEMGMYSDVTLIIMNYALKNHLSVKKYSDPEQLNIRWMFEFWKSKEVKTLSLFGGRNEYSQKEERAIERGLYKYPPFQGKDVKGNNVYTYRWNKIFWDETYHELLKTRSPQSIKDKARGTRNREGESIVALYHVQCKYRLKLDILVRGFSAEMEKKKKEILMKKKKISS